MCGYVSRLPLLATLVTAGVALAQVDAGMAAPLRIQTRANPDSVQLGQPFDVEIVITHESTQRYELETPGDLGDFDYLGQARSRVDGKDSSTTTIKVQLAAFKLDKQMTPSVKLQVSAPEGVQLLEITGVQVTVVSTLPADAQTKGENRYDIRPPLELPVRTWRLVYALLGLLAAALLAFGIYKYIKRPRVLVEAPAKPKAPLHVRTLTSLDELAKLNLPAQGRSREYYFRLSEIVRGYLGELYNFEALESTTPELIEALRSRHTPGLPMDQLTAFANQSDFVRYAKFDQSAEQCKESLELGYRIVHATTAALTPAQPAKPPASHGPERLS